MCFVQCVSAVILTEIVLKLFSFPFLGEVKCTFQHLRYIDVGSLSKILTETSSTDPGLLMPLCKCQHLTYVYCFIPVQWV